MAMDVLQCFQAFTYVFAAAHIMAENSLCLYVAVFLPIHVCCQPEHFLQSHVPIATIKLDGTCSHQIR